MKKNTKGFTLIELLAVIVILAIIALIATPIVLNLINKARQGAAQDSAYGVRKAAQLFYQSKLVDDINGFTGDVTITFTSSGYTANGYTDQAALNAAGFNIDGSVPTDGSIVITAATGAVNGSVTINGYTCPISNSGSITCSK